MEPPIPAGTILQNRYHILSVLGQGGFGRTYLAEDQGRFNERCALKELIPPETGAYALEKSKELFQREAESLYRINQPQIPQFRANFEQDGRLFLVQDYVEGKTYRELLNERKAQTYIQSTNPDGAGQVPPQAPNAGVFSEAEVRQLLLELLPVLDHIHSKNIIHRDITPDNIIRRSSDGLPMLIDFGVVKQVATQILTSAASAPVTTVGKVGYAPSEQIQTGRAYPSSDLYSLAATAVVLLTGKEPQALYDDRQMNWNWRRWANVSDDFVNILNRMLSYRPGDRYQSAMEVMHALQGRTPIPPQPVPPPAPAQQPDPNLSQVATMAVGRRPGSEPSTRNPRGSDPVIPDPNERSIWDNPAAVIGIGAALALLAGLGSYALISSLRGEPQASVTPTGTVTEPPLAAVPETPLATPTATPTATPSPTPTATPTAAPTPTSTAPTSYSKSLSLPVGRTITQTGNLRANTTVNYILQGEQGQRLIATIPEEGVLMTVVGPDGRPVNNRSQRVPRWEGRLPFTGKYTVQVSPVRGLSDSDYTLALTLTNPRVSPSPSPSPSPTTSPTTSPTYDSETLKLSPGQSVDRSGQTSPQKIKQYVVDVPQGQTMTVKVDGDVNVNVQYPSGDVAKNPSGETFAGPGVYKVDVIPKQDKGTDFKATLSFPNNAPTTSGNTTQKKSQ